MDSFIIRSELPEDIPPIFEVNLQAFGQDGEARLVNALRNDGDYLRELSLVAVSGDRVIGHILFPPITIVSDAGETAALALAPLAVHQDFQCRGIGAALINEGLRECRRRGHRIVVVVGHPGYYPRFGFTPPGSGGSVRRFPARTKPSWYGVLSPVHWTGFPVSCDIPRHLMPWAPTPLRLRPGSPPPFFPRSRDR